LSFAIVRTHPDLVRYAVGLQAKNSNELGFLPRIAFEHGAAESRIFIGLLNGSPCGYVLVSSGYRGILRCTQVCIQYDARRRLYGAMLVAAAEQHAEDLGCTRIFLRCGSDLPANEFWQSVGYTVIGTEPSGEARRGHRTHLNIWTKVLSPAFTATSWRNGRPRIYSSNAERQKAYRERLALRNLAESPCFRPEGGVGK
jgi:GNAT superfamily N-acetyltransferase